MAGFSITSGEMRSVGTLRKNNPIPNNNGGFDDNYSDVCTCRGRFRQQRASKSLEQGEIVQNKGFEWVCRYQLAIAMNLDVDAAWQINGQFYRISSWEEMDQIPQWFRFILNIWQ